jgi:hypothetical protein
MLLVGSEDPVLRGLMIADVRFHSSREQSSGEDINPLPASASPLAAWIEYVGTLMTYKHIGDL